MDACASVFWLSDFKKCCAYSALSWIANKSSWCINKQSFFFPDIDVKNVSSSHMLARNMNYFVSSRHLSLIKVS